MLGNRRNALWCGLFLILTVPSSLRAEEGPVVETRTLRAVGTVRPLCKSTLGSVVSGRVDSVFVDVGDVVQKKQPLMQLEQKFFSIAVAEAQAVLRSAHLEYEDAMRDFERMKKLFEKPSGQSPSISQKRFEDAKMRYEQAAVSVQKAQEAAHRAQTNLDESTIYAPYDGVITTRLVHPGDPINAAPVTKVLEMMSIENLYVEFSVPQLHMARLKSGTPVVYSIEGIASCIPATISRIYPDIEEKTRSIKCRVAIKNKDHAIHPGALVHIEIPLNGGGE